MDSLLLPQLLGDNGEGDCTSVLIVPIATPIAQTEDDLYDDGIVEHLIN